MIQEQVFSLQVSMDNVAAVTEVDRCNNLFELFSGILFCHTSVSHQVV